MGDITRGETFADGQTVNAERLHKLVDNATLNPGSVDTAELADGAVTTAKLNTTVVVQGGKVQIAKDKILVGDTAGFGAERALDQVEFTIGTTTVSLKALGIATGKLADGAVTDVKLADVAPDPKGTFGSASKIPVFKIDVKGRVIEASEVSLVGSPLTKWVSADTDIPAAIPAGTVPLTVTPAPTGSLIGLHGFMVSKGTEAGRIVGDLIPFEMAYASGNNNEYPAFTLTYTPATKVIGVTRKAGNLAILLTDLSGNQASLVENNLNTNWAMRVVALFA